MNTEKMTGMTIVITGGGTGMGAAMAKEFAAREAKIAILDINEERLKEVAKEINDKGGVCNYYKADVTKKAELEAAADDVEKTLGKIISWVNSAGISRMYPFLESTEEFWDKTMDVNMKGTFFGCQVAVTKMLENGGGTILNMASLSGKKASAWQTVYCASKFGVRGLTQAVAKEFADKNIRVNCLCPGIVHTEMWDVLKYDYAKKRNMEPDEVFDYFKNSIPMHRLVDIQDVLQAAIFFLTDCSSYLTGQSINLVGGEWME